MRADVGQEKNPQSNELYDNHTGAARFFRYMYAFSKVQSLSVRFVSMLMLSLSRAFTDRWGLQSVEADASAFDLPMCVLV